MCPRRGICTATLVLTVLVPSFIASNAKGQDLKRQKRSFREIAYNRAALHSFDRNSDGVILFSEAAFGIRSHAEVGSELDTPDINIRTKRDCSLVASFSDEVSYVLDCAADFARERLRRGDTDRSVLISEVVRHFSGEVENRDPHFGLCENLVDLNELPSGVLGNSSFFKHLPRRRLCRTLRNLGFCALTCLEVDHSRDPSPRPFIAEAVAPLVKNEINILVSSDWHAEAWYDVSNNEGINAEGDTRVSRYDASVEPNSWSCRANTTSETATPCAVTGENDPPLGFIATHLDAFIASNAHRETAFFFLGDMQAHDQDDVKMNWVTNVGDVQRTNLDEILLRFPDPSRIFMAPGNNDGPHSALFVGGNNVNNTAASIAWADCLLGAGIVTNALNRVYSNGITKSMSPIEFFNGTGYYLKKFETYSNCSSLFIMVINGMLGVDNEVQNEAISSDLAWMRTLGNAKVIVLGHYPSQMKAGSGMPQLAGYEDLILGTFAGHIHEAASTTANGFTQVPAISQGGTVDNAFFSLKLNPQNLQVDATLDKDLFRWAGTPGDFPTSGDWKCCG